MSRSDLATLVKKGAGNFSVLEDLWKDLLCAGLAPRNPIPADFKNELRSKYLPVMLQYGMDAAVEYLTQWVDGTLQLQPLLDVSAFLAIKMVFPPTLFKLESWTQIVFLGHFLSFYFVELFSHLF